MEASLRIARERIPPLVLTTGLIVAWGCGGGTPSVETSTEEATVRGTATVLGQPAKGSIVFDPSNYKRKDVDIRETKFEEDGSYAITTLVGPNSVMLSLENDIPANAEGIQTDLGFDVQPGSNTFDISLPEAP